MTPQTTSDVQLQTHVFTSAARQFGCHGRTFSPTTSTLVTGDSEAVLIDAQFITDEVRALGDMMSRPASS